MGPAYVQVLWRGTRSVGKGHCIYSGSINRSQRAQASELRVTSNNILLQYENQLDIRGTISGGIILLVGCVGVWVCVCVWGWGG